MSEAEIIGIDHGWSHIKTVSDVFVTSVREISTEPAFYDGVVEYQGKYYKIGGQRLEVKDTKVENDDFYILTLAAIAIELMYERCRRYRSKHYHFCQCKTWLT